MEWSRSMPSLRQLLYFICVAESESISRAAEILAVSQPPLTRAMHSLEDHIGEKLFVRNTNGVILTDAGQRTLERAKNIVESVRALSSIKDASNQFPISVGFSKYLDPGWASLLRGRIHSQVNSVSLAPLWGPSPELIGLVKSSSIDAALVGVPQEIVERENLEIIGYYDHLLFMPEEMSKKLNNKWELSELSEEVFLEQKNNIFPEYSRFIENAMRLANFYPKTRKVRFHDLGILLSQISRGEGITLLSDTLLNFSYVGAVAIPLPNDVSHLFKLPIAIAIGQNSILTKDKVFRTIFIEAVKWLVGKQNNFP